MAEYTKTKLEPESHILLDAPLLRLPHEQTRKTLTSAQRFIKHDKDLILTSFPGAVNAADPLAELDAMLTRLRTLKRKLSNLHEEETALHAASKARIQHLHELYTMPSLADVRYEHWSRIRLDRLLVDYLLRMGYAESARELAKAKGIENLVDVDAFVACFRVERRLREGRVQEALAWCKENADRLKKVDSNLEYELRLQQYIEMLRTGDKQRDAALHARKFLASHPDPAFVQRAAGLLAYGPNSTPPDPYRDLYSPKRWASLADLFLQTHHTLFSLPSQPLIHTAVSAGLSALKTPSCHSAFTSSSSNAHTASTSVCPICSTELHELARHVPYAHHSKSHVDSDPVVLPNNRVYGRERLMRFQEKMGTRKGLVRDLVEDVEYEEDLIRKVFIM